jgi:hypothetical protein
MRCLYDTARFDAAHHFEHLRRCDAGDRLLADPREHVGLEASDDLVAVARGPLIALDGVPLASDRLERI